MPFRHKAVDVFNHNDTVVDEHTKRQNEGEQYHEVECNAHQAQDRKRKEHGERNGNPYKESVAQAEPKHDDENNEHNTKKDIVLEIAHLHACEARLVVGNGKCKVGWKEVFLGIVYCCFDCIAGLEKVFASAFDDVEAYNRAFEFTSV